MKKILLLSSILLIALLAACSGSNEDAGVGGSNGSEESKEESTDNESSESKEISDTHLDTGDYVYEIKEIEQMESKFEDGTKIIAVELSFTNNSDEPASPWMSLGFFAEQETDTTVEQLNGANGLFPEDYKQELVVMGDTDVKPGATVDAVIGYELLYPGEPVRLYEAMAMSDEELTFERTVETTE